MAALNIPSESGSGDWHFGGIFKQPADEDTHPLQLAGIDYLDTNPALGTQGIYECSQILKKYRATNCPDVVYAASHIRAYVDLIVNAAAREGHYETAYQYDQWFNDEEAKEIRALLIRALALLSDDSAASLIDWFDRQLPESYRKGLPSSWRP